MLWLQFVNQQKPFPEKNMVAGRKGVRSIEAFGTDIYELSFMV